MGDNWINAKHVEYGLARPEAIERFNANREKIAATPINTETVSRKDRHRGSTLPTTYERRRHHHMRVPLRRSPHSVA
jgi:hypothetical protein